MMSDRWDRIREVFAEILAHPPEARAAALARICPDDAELRAEVDSLLAHDEQAGPSFLKPSPRGPDARASIQEHGIDPLIGQRLGKYVVQRLIAEGGMGSIYEARQDHPARTVALKIVHPWAWSPSAQRRFEFEVQALARLVHPHIAQIYDADAFLPPSQGGIEGGPGTPDSAEPSREPPDPSRDRQGAVVSRRPYFVMEFIPNARPITAYADEQQLDIRRRIELFLQACDAVQYGHQKGIIHRDLKPANILVSDQNCSRQEAALPDQNRARQEAERSVEIGTDHGIAGFRDQCADGPARSVPPALSPSTPLPSGRGSEKTPLPATADLRPCGRGSEKAVPSSLRGGACPDSLGIASSLAVVKVIDFGVARAADSDLHTLHTAAGQLVGTLSYMSPEQCASDALGLDVRTDVYSLGVVLYQLLCGRLPYGGSHEATEPPSHEGSEPRGSGARSEPRPPGSGARSEPRPLGSGVGCEDAGGEEGTGGRRDDESEPRPLGSGVGYGDAGADEGTRGHGHIGTNAGRGARSLHPLIPSSPGSSIYRMIRTICEEPPVRPGAIDRSLRGGLEAILLKALEKDRAKRYQSVADFAKDLRHYLNREPIDARPPGPFQRTARWMTRHPVYTTAAAATCVGSAALLGLLLSLWYLALRPHRIAIDHDANEAVLLSYSGNPLFRWSSPAAVPPVAKLLEVSKQLPARLAMVGFPSCQDDVRCGGLYAFHASEPEYDRALWVSRIGEGDLPRTEDFKTRAGFGAADFHAHDVWALDIFAEPAGFEIVSIFSHDYSRRLVRIQAADNGSVLYQAWYDGDIWSVYPAGELGLVLVSGTDAGLPLDTLGYTESVRPVPHVVFALKIQGKSPGGTILRPDLDISLDFMAWSKYLCPVASSGQLGSLRLLAPPASIDAKRYVQVQLVYHFDSRARASWIVDVATGEILRTRKPLAGDIYDRAARRGQIRPIEELDLCDRAEFLAAMRSRS